MTPCQLVSAQYYWSRSKENVRTRSIRPPDNTGNIKDKTQAVKNLETSHKKELSFFFFQYAAKYLNRLLVCQQSNSQHSALRSVASPYLQRLSTLLKEKESQTMRLVKVFFNLRYLILNKIIKHRLTELF